MKIINDEEAMCYVICTAFTNLFSFFLLERNSLLKHAVPVPRIVATSLVDSQHGLETVVRPS